MQPQFVTFKGHDYEFVDGQYQCLHHDYEIKTAEFDTMTNGEHDTYEDRIAVCTNPECDEEQVDIGASELYEEPDNDRSDN